MVYTRYNIHKYSRPHIKYLIIFGENCEMKEPKEMNETKTKTKTKRKEKKIKIIRRKIRSFLLLSSEPCTFMHIPYIRSMANTKYSSAHALVRHYEKKKKKNAAVKTYVGYIHSL